MIWKNLLHENLEQPAYKCWRDQVGCSATIFGQMPANIRFKSTNKHCVEIWIWGKIPSDYLWSDTRLGCPLVRCGPANRYCNICFLFSKPLANMQTDIAIYDVICHYLFQQEWRRRPVKNIRFSKSIRTRTSREVGTLQQVAWAVLSYINCRSFHELCWVASVWKNMSLSKSIRTRTSR